jgi:TldD protein
MTKLAAPFSPGGPTEIDGKLAERLLSTALERGGDYADLYFEYRAGADYGF